MSWVRPGFLQYTNKLNLRHHIVPWFCNELANQNEKPVWKWICSLWFGTTSELTWHFRAGSEFIKLSSKYAENKSRKRDVNLGLLVQLDFDTVGWCSKLQRTWHLLVRCFRWAKGDRQWAANWPQVPDAHKLWNRFNVSLLQGDGWYKQFPSRLSNVRSHVLEWSIDPSTSMLGPNFGEDGI